jgi:2-oxoglutarate ferredoxin oxidoreductase subunit alpha
VADQHTDVSKASTVDSISVAITGSGGSGAVTTGLILLDAVARGGFYGLLARSSGPQIRGGESAALLRFGSRPPGCMDDRFDLLLGLDWHNVERFVDEIPLDGNSLIVGDKAAGPVPEALTASGARVLELPLAELAGSVEGGRPNMVGLGVLARLSGLPQQALAESLHKVLGRKGKAIVDAGLGCIELGLDQVSAPVVTTPAPAGHDARWNISGNEASGLGAIRGGVRFVAAYPITPATEVLEWLAPHLEQLGGSLLQAEDELASINMIIGASYGGVPSLTATSGPGLALMLEGIGLAVASETPVVILDVMRGGPSTGIPTKSEQSDLNIAVYGLHGDAPHLVLAPLSIGDCTVATQWAVELSERLQVPALVLSDQSLGQSRAVIDPVPGEESAPARRLAVPEAGPYWRYALEVEDGISPMSVPGQPGGMYTADGLEHNPRGTPSSASADHLAQLDKRRRKLEDHDYGNGWAEISGEGETCLVTWGSTSGAVREAAARLEAAGHPVRVIALRLLAPLPREAITQALEGAQRVLVVEQNHGAQLFHYLHAEGALPPSAESLARAGPLPIRPAEVVQAATPGAS